MRRGFIFGDSWKKGWLRVFSRVPFPLFCFPNLQSAELELDDIEFCPDLEKFHFQREQRDPFLSFQLNIQRELEGKSNLTKVWLQSCVLRWRGTRDWSWIWFSVKSFAFAKSSGFWIEVQPQQCNLAGDQRKIVSFSLGPWFIPQIWMIFYPEIF